MTITYVTIDTYNIEILDIERNALIRVINYVIKELDWELSIRTGFTSLEYECLLNLLKDKKETTRPFQRDELLMLHDALNEVCHGISISNYEQEFGIDKTEIKALLTTLHLKLS